MLRLDKMLRLLTGKSLDLLIPPRCAGCDRRETWLCEQCRETLEPIPEPCCTICSRPNVPTAICIDCYRNRPPYDVMRAPWIHTGLARALVHDLKFKGHRHLASVIAEQMYRLVDPGVNLIIPVPLHRDRLSERGYNQSALLAYEIGQRLHCAVECRLLTRTRSTRPQTGLTKPDRLANVRGAFTLTLRIASDQHILLVDDVSTTGATIIACADVLRRNGAHRISAVVATRAIGDASL